MYLREVDHSFMCLKAIYISFSGNSLFIFFKPSFLFFPFIDFWNLLYVMEKLGLYFMLLIFFPWVCNFSFFLFSIQRVKFFNVVKSPNLFFYSMSPGSCVQKAIPKDFSHSEIPKIIPYFFLVLFWFHFYVEEFCYIWNLFWNGEWGRHPTCYFSKCLTSFYDWVIQEWIISKDGFCLFDNPSGHRKPAWGHSGPAGETHLFAFLQRDSG